jgi:hypothetical protein
MAIADLVYPSDIARRPNCFAEKNGGENMNEQKCECGCKPEQGWMPVPTPPVPVVPCPPPGPWYPPYPVPVPQPTPDPEPPKGSVAQQICKLSRKANTIDKMIDKINVNKKDVVLSVGGLTYNIGNVEADVEGWTDGAYADTIVRILQFELDRIKLEIAELAEQLGDD